MEEATATADTVHCLRITLKHSRPPIFRDVVVPSNLTLYGLHYVIQIAMGWDDDHLHQFILRDKSLTLSRDEVDRAIRDGSYRLDRSIFWRERGWRLFSSPIDPMGGPLDMDGEDETEVTVGELCPKVRTKKLSYEYDFGDRWIHEIEVKKIAPADESVKYPVCTGGARACPPEDSGGIWGFYEKLEAMTDKDHEDYDWVQEWLGDFDSEAFDLDQVNKTLTAFFHRPPRASKSKKRKSR